MKPPGFSIDRPQALAPYDAAMLTPAETAELRVKVQRASDRATASGKPVAIAQHAGGPLDGL